MLAVAAIGLPLILGGGGDGAATISALGPLGILGVLLFAAVLTVPVVRYFFRLGARTELTARKG